MRLQLNELVDPLAARVLYSRSAEGIHARFDISGVPRVDPLLAGKPIDDVPSIVMRLCGLCPITHHLAGIRALDALYGMSVAPAAQRVRQLLHHASVLDVLAPRVAAIYGDREQARSIKQLAKRVCAAAGLEGHFPFVAVPGGVTEQAASAFAHCDARSLLDAVAWAHGVFGALQLTTAPTLYDGVNVTVANESGDYDPLGDYLRADDELIPVADVPVKIRETYPFDSAPRPEIFVGGSWRTYRVGPAARYPHRDALSAQVESIMDSLAAISQILSTHIPSELVNVHADTYAAESPCSTPDAHGQDQRIHTVGTGAVDGPRGLLLHTYEVEGSVLSRCRILSPTAQNETWLAQMLSEALESGGDLETAIRAADPCLPCTAAPLGGMTIITEEN
ncbi:nickel-dependent hydrogenase large subunit [Corynebacterium felinum]|uniref:NAD-reducing hydrogenase large subunit n=1 Tax=Corynebacterium felinum TaxID=131318 RepID=A0ABU2B8E1_9CORY|nr:nickel-dependent hydrogenase large subunit [Corynebacterium felinum]MDF5820244.1 nickel-dependent hydrogenase large subunit [Corynebacterium felinum]MDR7354885.1 NAD-reducing hydrogenase large subunit [Corynebacterium felinum]WJY94245.1 NAD-reducing hydrogenase HoxS subunit beta [Corynebacterium felinum]